MLYQGVKILSKYLESGAVTESIPATIGLSGFRESLCILGSTWNTGVTGYLGMKVFFHHQ